MTKTTVQREKTGQGVMVTVRGVNDFFARCESYTDNPREMPAMALQFLGLAARPVEAVALLSWETDDQLRLVMVVSRIAGRWRDQLNREVDLLWSDEPGANE